LRGGECYGGTALLVFHLARSARTRPSNAHKEVGRLLDAGLVVDRRVGRSRLIHADENHELFRPLSEIVLKTFGPRTAISRKLTAIGGIDEAYIFGSWARRYSGEPGPAPHDVDVLVVGAPERREMNRAIEELQDEIGKEVGLVTVTASDWSQHASGFLRTVKNSPMVSLIEKDR